MTKPLWTPTDDAVARANLTRFMDRVRTERNAPVADYHELYQWSIDEPAAFWLSVWSFADIVAERRGQSVLADADKMPGARWFPDARLNFAENLLRLGEKAAPGILSPSTRTGPASGSAITAPKRQTEVQKSSIALIDQS